MVDKKYCDKCGKEIPLTKDGRAFFSVGLGDSNESLDLGQKWYTTKGKQICAISRRGVLCLDCYQEIIEFLNRKQDVSVGKA